MASPIPCFGSVPLHQRWSVDTLTPIKLASMDCVQPLRIRSLNICSHGNTFGYTYSFILNNCHYSLV